MKATNVSSHWSKAMKRRKSRCEPACAKMAGSKLKRRNLKRATSLRPSALTACRRKPKSASKILRAAKLRPPIRPTPNEARRHFALGPVRHEARVVHHVHRGGVVSGGNFLRAAHALVGFSADEFSARRHHCEQRHHARRRNDGDRHAPYRRGDEGHSSPRPACAP